MGYNLPAKVRVVLEKAWTFYYIPQSPSTHAQIYTSISPMNHLQGVRLHPSLTWLPEMEFQSAHTVHSTLFVDPIRSVLSLAQAGFVREIEGGAAIRYAARIQHPRGMAFPPMRQNLEASPPDRASTGC